MLFCRRELVAEQPGERADREERVRTDRAKIESDGFWIYNDLNKGIAEAKRTGKPMLVALRCVPCVECVKLDDELVDHDESIKPLLEQFVRVRLISTNGLDLSLFQFDYDQSFAMFLLHADLTIYGRYGTRSHHSQWEDDVSLQGLRETLKAGLQLHQDYANVRALLANKRGPKPAFDRPEMFPSLKGKYKSQIDFSNKVVPTCIHCHQVGEAVRDAAFRDTKEYADKTLFPYPHPKSQGLILDPASTAKVLSVTAGSPAEQAGFQSGDMIVSVERQPVISIADVQWVLQQTPDVGATLAIQINRSGKEMNLAWKLPANWRQRDDLSWRATTWELRRIALGGLKLDPVTAEARNQRGLSADKMALFVQHVGQYAPHDVAKKAGFAKGDVIVSFDGKTDLSRETDLLVYALRADPAKKSFAVEIIRQGERKQMTLPRPRRD